MLKTEHFSNLRQEEATDFERMNFKNHSRLNIDGRATRFLDSVLERGVNDSHHGASEQEDAHSWSGYYLNVSHDHVHAFAPMLKARQAWRRSLVG